MKCRCSSSGRNKISCHISLVMNIWMQLYSLCLYMYTFNMEVFTMTKWHTINKWTCAASAGELNICRMSNVYRQVIFENNVDFQKMNKTIQFPFFYTYNFHVIFLLDMPLICEVRVWERESYCGRLATELELSIHSRLFHFSGSLRPPSVHLPFLSPYLSLSLLYYHRDVLDVLCPLSLPANARSHNCLFQLWVG